VVKIEHDASPARARALLQYVQQQMLADLRYHSLVVYYDVDPM
jgi:primosomal protein N' (replication factor Y)